MIVKRYLYIVFLMVMISFLPKRIEAQVYGNEWITGNPGQQYYKLKTAVTGMYQVSYSELASVGIPVGSGPGAVNPNNFQLFHRGIEQNILITGASDNRFDAGDAIYFYGEMNDGTLDSMLYIPFSYQPHKFYNLYNDTTAYFLTWTNGASSHRILQDNTSNSLPAQPYHMEELLTVFADDYSRGTMYGESAESYGDRAEGWCSTRFRGSYDYQFNNISNVYTGAGYSAVLELMVVGRNENTNRSLSINVGSDMTNLPVTSAMDGYGIQKFFIPVSAANMTGGSLSVTVNSDAFISISYLKLRYTQQINMNGAQQKYVNLANPSSASTVQLPWTNGSSPLVFNITDKNNISLSNASLSGGTLSAMLPAGTSKIFINSTGNYLTAASIKIADLTPYPTTADFLIISHQKLWSAAQDYEAYRSSFSGGSHNVMLTDVQKLYDQFGYGEFTPVAIKRFCSYQIANNANAKYLFIIGKGVDVSLYAPSTSGNIFYRKAPSYFINNSDPTFKVEDLIPTCGSPASDIAYVMDNTFQAKLSVGRIFSKSTTDVESYKNKIQVHEEQIDSNFLWRKNLIHLSGGDVSVPGQIAEFHSYVEGYRTIVENSIFGGKVVHTYEKDPNSGTVDNQSIAEDVNNGLSYITFFGHGSGSVYDLDIGFVSYPSAGYNETTKFPMLIVNGCYTAASFYFTSLAEDWMNTPKKGALLVLGTSDIGYTGTLNNYTTGFYRQNFDTKANIGKSIGEIQRIVVNTVNTDLISNMQMLLHGDPCVKIYSPSRPDYEVSGIEERADVPKLPATLNTYDGSKLTSVTDSFYINIPIKNFGLYNPKPFVIVVKRTANGKEVIYKQVSYLGIPYLKTVQYPISTNDPSFFGLNKFEVFVDYTDSILEMREDNNIATIEYYMYLGAVTCLFPMEYSIVHDQPVTFVVQSTDLLIPQVSYYIEYDTSYLFNSSFKKNTVITAGSLAKWTNQLLLNTDSTVYYWRARYNDVPAGQDTIWSTSSFIYIKGSPDGWSQSKFAQFTKDVLNGVSLDVANRKWNFTNSSEKLYLKAYGNGDGDTYHDKTELSVGTLGAIMFPGYGYNNCGPASPSIPNEIASSEIDGMIGMFFNKSSLDYYYPSSGSDVCGRVPRSVVSPFKNLDNITTQNLLVSYIQGMKSGDIILLGSDGNLHADAWGTALKDSLKNAFGAALIDSLHDNMPYILLAKKGGSTPIFEKYSKDINASIILDSTITSKNNTGYIQSTVIGPATQWGTIYKKADSLANDIIRYKIIGINTNGDTATLLNNPVFFHSSFRGEDTLDIQSLINAKMYPNIRLMAFVSDTVNLTPPQLKKWQVIFRTVPEGTMDPFRAGLAQYTVGNKDEGDKICLSYYYENISPLPFDDSLKVKISLINQTVGTKDTVFIISQDSLKPGQFVTFNYCFYSKGYGGNNTIRAFVNPNESGFQPEMYYNNNIVEVNFEVIKDLTAPVIDVVFDGVHIIDGDVVSPSPLINIVLNDNSKFLLINDPNDISIYLIRPNSKVQEQILPSDPSILRYGQTPGKANAFSIEYNPKNLPDGIYTLQVQGKDVNGNKSGHLYTITFEVINASTITNFYPYPNPFSSNTRFVFTLTGSVIPDDLKIQIMTISGKVVREIMKAELGNIHIGNNKTDYAWDGTDEYGDKLANGVYLYRVVIKNPGDNFDHRDTAGDKSFHKDFGKLVILR